MSALGDLLGKGSIGEQFLVWGIAYQAAEVLLGPLRDVATQDLYGQFPVVVLTPAQLADMVIRNIRTEADAAGEAAKSGIDSARFHDMVLDTGEPPGLQFVLEAYRRGYIPLGDGTPGEATVTAAIRTSRLRDEWTDIILKMALAPPSVADAVNAVLRGQIPRDQGQTIAYQNGISGDDFTILLNTAGRPPSPGELVEFARRGFIPFKGTGPDALTFEQGIFEGDSKDKWEPIFERLAEYLPPPRTITALERAGALTSDQAQNLYQQHGLSKDLAAAYSKAASGEKLAGTRALAEGVVLGLYESRGLTVAEASTHLAALGYDAADVAVLLGYTDLKRELAVLQSAETRIGALYVGHKISRQTAAANLAHLDFPLERTAHLLAAWDAERLANVKTPTPAAIATGFYYGNLTQAEAMQALEGEGLTPFAAWLELSNRVHGPIPGKPPMGALDPARL